MNIKILYLSIIVALLVGCKAEETKILIVGDSISLGYTPFVKDSLANEGVIVEHNNGNAQDSGYGLKNIGKWIKSGDYDIIQFNWGLWDLCYRHPDSKVQGNRDKVNGTLTYTLEEYEQHLEDIVKILEKETDAQLIFVTTTYVPKEEVGRFPEDPQKYNEVAKKVMKRHSIPVNDIFERSISIHKQYGQGVDNVHYWDDGYKELSKLIISYLKPYL